MLKEVPNASDSVDGPSTSGTRSRDSVRPLAADGAELQDSGVRNLLRRASEGDPKAVGELYDTHHRAVRALVVRLIGDEATAEDIVHDVFVALPRALTRFEGRSALRTFILSVAVNLVRRKIRSSSRRRAAMKRLALEPITATGTDPERQHRRKRLAEALQKALAALPEPQREAFVLCVVEERTSREASEILEVPEGTVRTRLFHAKRKLRAMLEGPSLRSGESS